jgi:urea transporter
MKVYLQKLYRRPAFWLAILAGVLYCSWPLAYVLNPAVGRHALASQLETPGQPFNWVFIGGDVFTGVVLAIAILLQRRAVRQADKALRWSAIGYVLFGLLAATAAIVPLNCDPQAGTCGVLWRDPYIIVHGAASMVSVIALLVSVAVLGIVVYRRHASRAARYTFGAVLAGWLLFGIGSVVEFLLHVTGNAMQDYFITLCSISVVVVIGALEYLHLPKKTGWVVAAVERQLQT